MAEDKIGKVTHFFDKIQVAIVKLEKPLKVGEKIKIKGNTTEVEEVVESMQVEHAKIEQAEIGDEVGIKVAGRVREGDTVFLA